jgi:transcriptional regulator with XRE-family HTH domain
MKRGGHFNRGELKGVGRRLRLLRVARGWSLSKLSDVSDVSVAAIRKIELGESNPSLLTVLALVEALDEPLDRLISEALSSGTQLQLVRANEAPDVRAETPLSDSLDNPMMTGRRITLAAGETLADAANGRPLFGYVLDGEVVLARDDGRENRCARGDAFHVFQPQSETVRGSTRGAKLVVVENVSNA